MTTTTFTPNTTSVFQFQATLDGQTYGVSIPWNIYRQDWYLSITDQSNNQILYTPLIGSPPLPEYGINLVGGYFQTSTIYYYINAGNIVVTP